MSVSTHQRTHRTTHRLGINAPADLVFSMLRDASHWPYLDGLTVYSERVSGDDAGHELRTSVVSNGSLSSSHCWRVFDAASHRAEFHQLDLEPPLRELGGGWEIRPEALRVSCERLSVLLQHHAPQSHPTPHPTAQSTAKEA